MSIILNLQKLAKNPFRQKALLIAEAGYEAIEIKETILRKIKLNKDYLSISTTNELGLLKETKIKYKVKYKGKDNKFEKIIKINLNKYKRIFLVGIGKGSALASATLAKILGNKLTGGIALDVQNVKCQMSNVKCFQGSHPLPSKQNIIATQKIIELVKNLKKDDLLITFICGGGSALLCGSEKEMRYSRTIFKELTEAGANILELNTVRKHLSEVKGGNLAKFAYPARIISLIVSDVLGNDLSMVASGPTVFDKTTKKDAEKVLRKYLRKSARLSALVRDLEETPKAKPRSERSSTTGDKKYFKKVKNILFLSNREPILAMVKKAKELGFKPKIYSLKLYGEAKNALLPLIKNVPRVERAVILAGGETTVKLKNQESGIRNYGKGGRNMEAVLGALNLFHNSYFILHNSVIISVASDGRDNTEAAGAIGDILTIKKAQKLKLNPQKYLKNHNSFNFFKKIGDLIFAEQKTFNVADLMVVLRE